jgi:hypothetical protein
MLLLLIAHALSQSSSTTSASSATPLGKVREAERQAAKLVRVKGVAAFYVNGESSQGPRPYSRSTAGRSSRGWLQESRVPAHLSGTGPLDSRRGWRAETAPLERQPGAPFEGLRSSLPGAARAACLPLSGLSSCSGPGSLHLAQRPTTRLGARISPRARPHPRTADAEAQRAELDPPAWPATGSSRRLRVRPGPARHARARGSAPPPKSPSNRARVRAAPRWPRDEPPRRGGRHGRSGACHPQ